MFKKFQPALLAGAIALAAGGQAFAQTAPTAQLSVIGDITAPTCDVGVTNSGKFDYGNISPTVIGSAVYSLGNQTQTLTVSCDASTYMLYQTVDNAAASVSSVSTSNFGLGMVNTTGKLGYYTLKMQNATVDGASSSVGYGPSTLGSALTGCAASESVYNGANKMAWCTSTTAMKAGKVFTTDLVSTAYLNTETGMGGAITTDVSLAGSTTLTFQFAL